MTQKDKELLLKDLCARLPYKVKCNALLKQIDGSLKSVFGSFKGYDGFATVGNNLVDIETVRPYLRPMSSMTDEERDELWHLSEEYFGKAIDKQIEESLSSSDRNESEILEYIASSVIVDWLNVHHFDHRGLIEKDLALEAPEGMYI